MNTLEEMSKGLDFESLSNMQEGEKLLSSIDYTRPLNEYATADDISFFLNTRDKPRHVYTKDLNLNGRVVKEDMEKYLSAKEYINSGALKEAQKSPLHLFYATESGWKERLDSYMKKKDYFVLGEFIHQAILEPGKFSRVIVEPDYKQNSKKGLLSLISFWEDKIQSLNEIVVNDTKISGSQYIDMLKDESGSFELDRMDSLKLYYNILKSKSGFTSVDEIDKQIIDITYFNYKRYGDGLLPELLKHSKREISVYYDDPDYGIKQRIRPDAMQFSENIGADTIISVKSTRAESISHYCYQSAKLNYELTEGMYCEVAGKVTGRDFRCVINIMVQTLPPYGVAVLVWDAEDIEIGKYKYYQALQTVAECREKGKYPGYDAYAEAGHRGLINMKQPSWNAKELYPVDIDN